MRSRTIPEIRASGCPRNLQVATFVEGDESDLDGVRCRQQMELSGFAAHELPDSRIHDPLSMASLPCEDCAVIDIPASGRVMPGRRDRRDRRASRRAPGIPARPAP